MKLKNALIVSLIGLGLTAGVAVAELGDASKLPAAASGKISYKKDIKPLFEASCLKCHSGDRPKSKYKMDTVANIIKGGSSDEVAIVAGNSAKSAIVHYMADLVEDLEMPPTSKRDKYPALTKEQLGKVRAWIDQGARDN